jgi:ADP-ribose pyrophosphatase YjhB (NUDIX family)
VARTEHRARNDALLAARGVDVNVEAFVQDDRGRILLQQRADHHWALPAGGRAPGESLGQAIVRALARQFRMNVEVLGVVGIYRETDEPHQRVSVCLRVRPLGAEPVPIRSVRWVVQDELGALPIRESTQVRIAHGLEQRTQPYIG